MQGSYEDLSNRLEQMSEELADLAMAQLREAMEDDGRDAAAEERVLTRARRAVDKAAALLRSIDQGR